MEEKEERRIKLLTQKDKYELKYCGGYERIYPLLPEQIAEDARLEKLQDQYEYLIEASSAVFGEQVAGGGISAKKRIDEILERKNQT